MHLFRQFLGGTGGELLLLFGRVKLPRSTWNQKKHGETLVFDDVVVANVLFISFSEI